MKNTIPRRKGNNSVNLKKSNKANYIGWGEGMSDLFISRS